MRPVQQSDAIYLRQDDWGGFYDYMSPPVLETWTDGTPYRYRLRRPCIIGPYAKSGHGSHATAAQLTLLRFTEKLHRLPPLTERDAPAGDMPDYIDFS